MPLPLLAVAALAVPLLSDAGKGMKDNNAMLLVAGLGALWLFNQVKGPLEALKKYEDQLDIFPEAGEFLEGVTKGPPRPTYVPNQFERGLSPNPPSQAWWDAYGDEDMLYDAPPIQVQRGLDPPTAAVYRLPVTTKAEEFGIWTGQVWSMFDPVNPYEVDLPGVDPYDLRDIPGDIGGAFKKLWVW